MKDYFLNSMDELLGNLPNNVKERIAAALSKIVKSNTAYPGSTMFLKSIYRACANNVSSTHKRYLDLDFHLRLFRSRRSAT